MFHRDRSRHSTNHRPYWRLALSGATLAMGAAVYASLIEPRTLLIRKIDLAIPALPAPLSGTRIAFLSDFHLGGPGDPLGSARRALSVLQDEHPDLILLGGDYFDRGIRVPAEIDWRTFPALAPTLAVPGNHDYHKSKASTAEIFDTLTDAGISLLRNQSRDVSVRGQTIQIVGLDDPFTGRANYAQSVADATRRTTPRIILAHAGLVADYLPVGAADLILSGHTHDAQIRISPFRHTTPLDIFWWLDRIHGNPVSPYRQGMFRVRGSMLYTGNGLGTTSLGMRFFAPPEIALFTLVSGDGHQKRACDDPDRYVLRNQSTRIW